MPELTAEIRERVVDGELITISAEDKRQAGNLAAMMDEHLSGKVTMIQALLAVQILSVHTVEFVAGREWASALNEVFKQIPIE